MTGSVSRPGKRFPRSRRLLATGSVTTVVSVIMSVIVKGRLDLARAHVHDTVEEAEGAHRPPSRRASSAPSPQP
ncbi:hypothetical protein [Actinopolymorpha pittospori]